jgi:hypothetical protein
MKIIKYILLIGILVTLYITESLWRPLPDSNDTEVSQIDKEIKKQQDYRKNLNAEEAEKSRKYEDKFGKKPSVAYKSRVPKPLQEYWDETLDENDTIYEDICSRLEATDNGWTTTCQYKIKGMNGSSGLKIDTFIIKDGKLLK